jgi:hypothetical protein
MTDVAVVMLITVHGSTFPYLGYIYMAYGISEGAVLLSLLSPLCNAVTVTNHKQTKFVYIGLQLLCIYSLLFGAYPQ